MSYISFRTVAFGTSKAGLGTVGYRLYDAGGAAQGARVTAGVQDLSSGAYGALLTLPDSFQGRVTWDTGESVPAFASEGLNPAETENPDVKTSSGAASAAAAVWAAATRTLTQAIAAVSPPPLIQGTLVTVRRGDTWVLPFVNLGSLAGRSKLWLTVKGAASDTDLQAVLQIEETGGLLRLGGAAATSGQGSLVVTDPNAGNLTVTLAAVAASLLAPGTHYYYDAQVLVGTTVRTVTGGDWAIISDVTETIS